MISWLSYNLASMRCREDERGSIMAKRKKQSKVKKRGKLPRGNSAKRSKARRVKAAKKRTVAKAKRAPVKKAARKVKRPVTRVVETVAVEVIEQPAPGVINDTEIEETPGSGLERALKRMNPNR
jgi:hypothetical protein